MRSTRRNEYFRTAFLFVSIRQPTLLCIILRLWKCRGGRVTSGLWRTIVATGSSSVCLASLSSTRISHWAFRSMRWRPDSEWVPTSVTATPCSAQHPCYGCTATANRVVNTTRPATYETVLIKYARNNSAFLADFGVAYSKIMTVGYLLTGDGVFTGKSVSTTGKLGTLQLFDMSKCLL